MFVSIRQGEKVLIEKDCDKDQVIVGRSSSCDISIDSDYISRNHLEIKKDGSKLFIKDISTSNWISYDSKKLSKESYEQYFEFMELVLPGDFIVKVDLDPDAKEKTNLVEIKTISKTSTISRTNISRKPEEMDTQTGSKKRSRRRRQKSLDEIVDEVKDIEVEKEEKAPLNLNKKTNLYLVIFFVIAILGILLFL